MCGRSYQNRLRDWAVLLVLVIILGSLLRAERERREYGAAKQELIRLGHETQAFLDSLRGR